MPVFDDQLTTAAEPEDVWKLLYDPLRFPLWWAGFGAATPGDANGGDADVTLWPTDYPDFPLPQMVSSRPVDRQVVVSCTVSELVFEWRLEPLEPGTRISVHVEIPEKESFREGAQRQVVTQSLHRLAELAALASGSPP